MPDQYQDLLDKFNFLEQQIADPAVISSPAKLKTLSLEYNELKPAAEKVRQLQELQRQLADNDIIINEATEAELQALAASESEALLLKIKELDAELADLLKPHDPRDKKDVMMEIRAGAGGDEAALFAGDLFRMYTRFAETRGWRTSLLSTNRIGIGGFKEVILEINGSNVFSTLKFESGVHRVQRVPETEKSGRIHTSTATVAVLPIAEDIEIGVRPEDVKIDVFRSSGPGGQSVNTTDSAVRLTHLPSGLVISCQDEKSQLQNKEKAMRILKSKLLQLEEEKRAREEKDARRSQVGAGMRAEKIRTYNFPQDRLTDHRLKQSWHNLASILNGDIDGIISALSRELA